MRYMASDLSCGHGSSEKDQFTAYLTRTPFYLSMHPQQGTDQFVCHLMKARSFIQFGNQFNKGDSTFSSLI